MGRLLKRDDNESGDVIEMEKRHVVKWRIIINNNNNRDI
jgi:hypothetical protein